MAWSINEPDITSADHPKVNSTAAAAQTSTFGAKLPKNLRFSLHISKKVVPLQRIYWKNGQNAEISCWRNVQNAEISCWKNVQNAEISYWKNGQNRI